MKLILKVLGNEEEKYQISLNKIVRYQLTKLNCQFDNKKSGLSDIIINNIIRVRALISSPPPTAYTNYLRRLKLGMNGPLVNTFWASQAIFEFWTLSQDIAENRFLHYTSNTKVFLSYIFLDK